MNTTIFLLIILSYFTILYLISYFTSRNDGNSAFFLGNRKAPWYVIAYGMIGTTLSGITFISVPGWVNSSQFSYMQMVFGFFVGYFIISRVLLPLYYKMELVSIYSYLKTRFGVFSYKTGSSLFLISRTIGASFRLYLIASVLQFAIFDSINIPFYLTVLITIILIWVYTYRSGIKTIIWTDAIQTTLMILSVVIIGYFLTKNLEISLIDMFNKIKESPSSRIFFFEDISDKKYFWKQFLSGVFMAIVMTGLDQDQMQKNLSCKNLKDAQKNMFSFSLILIVVDILFLSLGALLLIYSQEFGLIIPNNPDMLFPNIALNSGLPQFVGIIFLLGIVAAAYSSADSALTSLTTSFCIDIMDFEKKPKSEQVVFRKKSHLLMSFILFCVIMIFNLINDDSVIKSLFTVAGYTYGPLLGIFAYGLFTQHKVIDKYVPLVAVISPVICYFINIYLNLGFELLIVNGLISFIAMDIIRKGNYYWE
tara:strand:+ start:730 stop:2166 length:1437 start_codon:yes stop_codon:yes gene_type:complete